MAAKVDPVAYPAPVEASCVASCAWQRREQSWEWAWPALQLWPGVEAEAAPEAAACTRVAVSGGDSDFFGGDAPTHADFNVYHHLDKARTAEPACVESEPLLRWMERMGELCAVASIAVVGLTPAVAVEAHGRAHR